MSHKWNDPSQWPEDLRVRQYPSWSVAGASQAAAAAPDTCHNPAAARPEGDGESRDLSNLRAVTVEEFLRQKLPPRQRILAPILSERETALVFGRPGAGKTYFLVSAAVAIASGGEFLGLRAPTARKVLYVDAEMPADLMQGRLPPIIAGIGQPVPGYLRLLSREHCRGVMADLGSKDGQDAMEREIGDARVVILDNLAKLVRRAHDWDAVEEWLLRQRREGRSLVVVHHAGKNGSQFGSSNKEFALDTIICLRHPRGYSAADGARFVVEFQKARSFYGDDAAAFEARYCDPEGKAIWTRSPVVEGADTSTRDNEVALALAKGMKIRGVASQLGMSKSAVGRIAVRLSRDDGTA